MTECPVISTPFGMPGTKGMRSCLISQPHMPRIIVMRVPEVCQAYHTFLRWTISCGFAWTSQEIVRVAKTTFIRAHTRRFLLGVIHFSSPVLRVSHESEFPHPLGTLLRRHLPTDLVNGFVEGLKEAGTVSFVKRRRSSSNLTQLPQFREQVASCKRKANIVV